jgi:hypothetical protein
VEVHDHRVILAAEEVKEVLAMHFNPVERLVIDGRSSCKPAALPPHIRLASLAHIIKHLA